MTRFTKPSAKRKPSEGKKRGKAASGPCHLCGDEGLVPCGATGWEMCSACSDEAGAADHARPSLDPVGYNDAGEPVRRAPLGRVQSEDDQ